MRRKLEYALFIAGFAGLLLFCVSYFKFQLFQHLALKAELHSRVTPSPLLKTVNSHPVTGRLSIRRIGFMVAMVEGDDEESLEIAAGHMPGTAQAGRPGNMIVAGHRDGAFWPLRNVRPGDRIEVAGEKTAVYRVQNSAIVDPDNVTALANTDEPVLTLVTCYPFRHVGPAPQRFIVRARLVSLE